VRKALHFVNLHQVLHHSKRPANCGPVALYKTPSAVALLIAVLPRSKHGGAINNFSYPYIHNDNLLRMFAWGHSLFVDLHPKQYDAPKVLYRSVAKY
jgi:hypothetical protein